MGIPNAYCKKHDEIEPQDHDFYTDGLWVCKKCANERKPKLIEGMKPVDYALKQIKEKYGKK
jgi:hypothetical protein